MVQWLGLRAFIEGGPDLTPGQETKTLQAAGLRQKKKKVSPYLTRDLLVCVLFCFLMQEHLDNDDSHKTTTGVTL